MNDDRQRMDAGWVLLCFAAIYLVWGSTFLAIRYAVEDLPPLLMAGARFLAAGAVLCAAAKLRGAGRISPRAWASSVLVGTLLFGGNALLAWAEKRVPSGLAALMLATIPLWMTGLDSLRKDARPLSARQRAGFGLGLAGMVVLVGPGQLLGARSVDPLAAVALVGAALSWSVGSLVSRKLPQPADPVSAAGLPMVSGGAVLLAAALFAGDGAAVLERGASARAALSWGYLVVMGSLVGFSAYSWLLRRVSPALVSTYAFVNPVVALAVGWAAVGEVLTGRGALAAVLIVAAVAMIVIPRRAPRPVLKPALSADGA
ncbi:MAG TPA: EamA family transporter [Myxococcales bacterium]|jgi:drug/metabolite transporter (DMT)-like permease|nr:EamA family transporter [Myxococcales bacterium]